MNPVYSTLVTGFIGLAVALGIGRFAFTPMLPLMHADAGLTLLDGNWIATANYLGYMVGALLAGRLAWSSERQFKAGLVVTIVATALMALPNVLWSWLALRTAAGVASAWVMVSASTICLARLEALSRSDLASRVFAGVGSSITLAGLVCLFLASLHWSSSSIWLVLTGLAIAGGAVAIRTLDRLPAAPAPARPSAGDTMTAYQGRLIFCYALLGFGYILPATFLPAQARQLTTDPKLFGWAWPIFGIACAVSTLLLGRLAATLSRRTLWGSSQIVMAIGILVPVLLPGLVSIAIAALCVGGTFVAATMLGLQEARATSPQGARRVLAAMTAAFALGQLAGPLSLALFAGDFGQKLDAALILAALGLISSSLLILVARPKLHLQAGRGA